MSSENGDGSEGVFVSSGIFACCVFGELGICVVLLWILSVREFRAVMGWKLILGKDFRYFTS